MSAFIVSMVHISLMVEAALSYRYGHIEFSFYNGAGRTTVNRDNVAEIGQMLLNENYKSVNYRYRELSMPPRYEHVHILPRKYGIVYILKQIDCYEYQSCEHPGWKDSCAHHFCQSLRSRLIDSLPGYDEAPWGVSDSDLKTDVP